MYDGKQENFSIVFRCDFHIIWEVMTMKLSPALLCRELSKLYPVATDGPLSVEPVLTRPQLLEPGAAPAEGALCVAPAGEDWSAAADRAGLVLTVGSGTPRGRQAVVDAPSTAAVYNAIQAVFDRFDGWYSDLSDSRLQGQSIQTLLELSHNLLGKPLVVIGMDFSVIASVEGESHGMARGMFGATEDTYDVLTTLKHSGKYEAVRQLDGWFHFYSEEEMGSCMCVNIKKYGQTTYRLMMFDTEEQQEPVYGFLLEYLAAMVEHALLHNTAPVSGGSHAIRTILHTAISDRTADYVTISQRLDGCGWHSSHEYLCIVLQLSYLDQKNLTIHAICSYIENILSGSCAFQYKDDIVVFVDLTLSSMSQTDISSRLSCFVRDSLLKAGYSRVLLGHFNFRRQYDQASIALEVGTRRNPSFWIHRFNDIAFDYILEQATRKLPGYMLSHERLLRLKYGDEENGTEYLRTLRLYLDNHLNAVQTARELFIHRSTFLYRLERIKAVLGTDLTDPDEILYLMLSFRLMERETPADPSRPAGQHSDQNRKHPV